MLKTKWIVIIVLTAMFGSWSMFSLGSETSADSAHVLGLFFGRTKGPYDTENTWGLEYEYKFDNQLGAGIVVEETSDGHHGDGVQVYIASFYYHADNWRFGLGFGKEKVDSMPSHSESLKRLSISYDFHLGSFGLAPTFTFDRVAGENIKVWGLTLMKSF